MAEIERKEQERQDKLQELHRKNEEIRKEWIASLVAAQDKPWNVWSATKLKYETDWAPQLAPLSWDLLLHKAAAAGDVAGIHHYLYQHPDRLGEKDNFGYTALHTAIEATEADAAVVLIEYTLQHPEAAMLLDARSNERRTALHLTVVHDEVRVCQKLLEAKANGTVYL